MLGRLGFSSLWLALAGESDIHRPATLTTPRSDTSRLQPRRIRTILYHGRPSPAPAPPVTRLSPRHRSIRRYTSLASQPHLSTLSRPLLHTIRPSRPTRARFGEGSCPRAQIMPGSVLIFDECRTRHTVDALGAPVLSSTPPGHLPLMRVMWGQKIPAQRRNQTACAPRLAQQADRPSRSCPHTARSGLHHPSLSMFREVRIGLGVAGARRGSTESSTRTRSGFCARFALVYAYSASPPRLRGPGPISGREATKHADAWR